MNKSTLIAGVMAFVAFTSCHSGKSGDHGEDIHAGEEHVESGENKKEEAHAGEIVLPVEKAKAAGVVAEVINPGDFQTVIQASGSLQSASGDETYSRTSVAVSICTYVGNVVELRELYTDVYTAAGEFVGSRNIIYTVTAVPYAFDGGFGMVSTAYDNTRALFILTPVVAYKANNDIPAGCDGTLIARTEEDGRTAIYEYDRPSEKTFVGYADSAAFAFTDALYSVGEEGRISRRTALKKRVLYMGDEFTYQSQHPMTGTVRSRDEGEVAFTATGGQV